MKRTTMKERLASCVENLRISRGLFTMTLEVLDESQPCHVKVRRVVKAKDAAST
jgi:hypothetical protein